MDPPGGPRLPERRRRGGRRRGIVELDLRRRREVRRAQGTVLRRAVLRERVPHGLPRARAARLARPDHRRLAVVVPRGRSDEIRDGVLLLRRSRARPRPGLRLGAARPAPAPRRGRRALGEIGLPVRGTAGVRARLGAALRAGRSRRLVPVRPRQRPRPRHRQRGALRQGRRPGRRHHRLPRLLFRRRAQRRGGAAAREHAPELGRARAARRQAPEDRGGRRGRQHGLLQLRGRLQQRIERREPAGLRRPARRRRARALRAGLGPLPRPR
mmetsp:Transcript_22385/g.70117  ORF Transcript_22385/g.70117 Transcript_22385/m.70117 type:complete len:270 (-) Transcript_22385:313-1122(-)